MRDDIAAMIKKRPSWILSQDKDYQDILQALEYARKLNNREAIEELELWRDQRKVFLLEINQK